jgi:hypothetical protein
MSSVLSIIHHEKTGKLFMFSSNTASAAHSPFASAQPLTKAQKLQLLKQQAQAKKKAEGNQAMPAALQDLADSTRPVQARITTTTGKMKAATAAGRFLGHLNAQKTTTTKLVSKQPFPTIADPEILIEADAIPTEQVMDMELSSHVDSARYQQFKAYCQEKDVPAGIAALLSQHLAQDFTHIMIDNSGSMSITDPSARPQIKNNFERNYDVEITDLGENLNGMRLPNSNRMTEAKQRIVDALPMALGANTLGQVKLSTLSDTRGITLDMRRESYDSAMNKALGYLRYVQPDLDHTPSVSAYRLAAQEANQKIATQQVSSATLVYFTDGEPNQAVDHEAEKLYQHYQHTVLGQRQDYRRPDGSIVPYHQAVNWNMDADTPPLMRRLSVLCGHFNLPTTIAACTNDEHAMGEQNELDGIHTNVATLDDVQSEIKEVVRHQGLRFPFSIGTYIAFLFLAPKVNAFDKIDEEPLTPNELESYLGYYPGHDAYLDNLATAQIVVEADAEMNGLSNQANAQGMRR